MPIARENMVRAIFEDTAYVAATEALGKQLFLTELGAVAGAGEAGCVSQYDWAIGDRYSVVRVGTAKVIAGAAVAVGAYVKSDANGKAVTHDTGAINGRALTAAAQAGDVIVISVPG